jgi:hypothetical protein
MAAYGTSLTQTYSPVVGVGDHRAIVCGGAAIIAVTTAMIDNANDDIGAFYVDKGFVVTGAVFAATDIDEATGLVVDVGIAGTEALFIAGATTGQAAGLTNALAQAGFLYKFTAKTQVRVFINTASATPAAGTIKVALFGFFDPEFSTTALVAA